MEDERPRFQTDALGVIVSIAIRSSRTYPSGFSRSLLPTSSVPWTRRIVFSRALLDRSEEPLFESFGLVAEDCSG
jgi:hypothetical protein